MKDLVEFLLRDWSNEERFLSLINGKILFINVRCKFFKIYCEEGQVGKKQLILIDWFFDTFDTFKGVFNGPVPVTLWCYPFLPWNILNSILIFEQYNTICECNDILYPLSIFDIRRLQCVLKLNHQKFFYKKQCITILILGWMYRRRKPREYTGRSRHEDFSMRSTCTFAFWSFVSLHQYCG